MNKLKVKAILFTVLLAVFASNSYSADLFSNVGTEAQGIFETVQDSILKQVNLVAKSLSRYTATLLGSLYSMWLLWRVFKAIVDNDGKEFVKILFKQTAVLIVVLFLIYNLDVLNLYLQTPVIKTYNAFGQSLLQTSLGVSNSRELISTIGDLMNNSVNEINSKDTLSIWGDIMQVLLAVVVFAMLFLVFIQIFLTLITNYFKIMLPFAISPILLMFFFFPSLRQIPIKALNIMLDGIIKQGFIIMVVIIMSSTLESSLTSDIDFLDKLLIILIFSFIYKQLLTTADSLSSELIGTQQLGVNPTQGGGLLGAMAGVGAMAMKHISSGNTTLGGLLKGSFGGASGQGVSTGGAKTLQGKAGHLVGSAIGTGGKFLANQAGNFAWKVSDAQKMSNTEASFDNALSKQAKQQGLQNASQGVTPESLQSGSTSTQSSTESKNTSSAKNNQTTQNNSTKGEK